MLDTLERMTTAEQPLDTTAKRALIEVELRKDAGRSDREIARIIGCDHKTVGAARERLGIASPLGNSPSGVGDAVVARADVKVSAVVDEMAAEGGNYYWHIPHQARIECRALTDGGVEVWQEGQNGSSEEVTIHVAAANVVMLARHLLYAAGFKSIGIYTHERGGNVDIEDGHLASNYYEDKPGYGPVR